MNFAADQADPKRRVIGFGAVLLFHLILVWALVSGLGKKVVELVKPPIETKVIEEVKPPPPPPEVALPPPPKMEAPPPPFIPPPEIQLQTPPPPAPAITTTPTPPPPAPVVIAPAPPALVVVDAPPAPPAPPPAPAPAVASAGTACPNHVTAMGDAGFPRDAQRQGLERGEAVIEFVVGPNGQIKSSRVVSSTHPVFARNSQRLVQQEFKCVGQGQDVTVTVPFRYRVQ